MAPADRAQRAEAGYPAYAWPGGYPLAYLAGTDTLCPEDARRLRRGSPFIHWEGDPIVCDECGREVASAYGNPEDDTTCH